MAATGALIAACAPATPKPVEVAEEAAVERVVTETPVAEEEAPAEEAATATPAVEKEAPTATPAGEEETKAEEPANTLIASTADVPPGSSVDFAYKEKPAILVNLDGEYKAYRNVCTHNGCPTKYSGKDTLDCPCHGSKFEVATGKAIEGPATAPLLEIEVFTEEDSVYYMS